MAGLVAISPACADVDAVGAILIGLVAGVASALAIGIKYRFNYDDSLDVVAVHLVSGFVGTMALGFLALPSEASAGGLFHGGGADQLVAQLVATFFALLYSAAVTAVIALLIHKTIGFRVDEAAELSGVDEHQHAERAYHFGSLSSFGR